MRVQLTGGAYQSASLIQSAQRCINLFVETIPGAQGEPARATHFPTPGLLRLHTFSGGGPVRDVYAASNGDLYAVAGAVVYFVGPDWSETYICQLTTASGPVSMSDNTLTLFIVDGSPRGTDASTLGGGVQIDLATKNPTTLPTTDEGFLGADRVEYLGTFFVFNQHQTPNFFVSGSLAATFTPLDFAAKSGASDYLVSPVASRGQLWLLGRDTSEVWTLSGAPDFPFQQLQGVLIEHGCIAVASIAKADGSIFWLSRDKQGRCVVLKSNGYQAERISTHAIENTLVNLVSVDAVGYCYQVQGHVFYVISFPSADATYVYDAAEKQWHQWVSFDAQGGAHRHRSNCFAYAYDHHVVGDYQTGDLYQLVPGAATDNGVPIKRIRSFPHMIDDDQRIAYKRFVADMDVGGAGGVVTLRWSDDRGATYGNPLFLSLGDAGQTNLSLQWRRLGQARDRVFELSWATAATLNGAFIDVEAAAS